MFYPQEGGDIGDVVNNQQNQSFSLGDFQTTLAEGWTCWLGKIDWKTLRELCLKQSNYLGKPTCPLPSAHVILVLITLFSNKGSDESAQMCRLASALDAYLTKFGCR